MCAAPIYSFYGSWESVGPFVEGAALQEIYSILAAIWRWEGTRYVLLTHHVHKGYRWRGQWCAFSNSQKATAASQRITEVYHPSNGSYISKLLNPWPAAPGQDALGLITLYPRPDELSSFPRPQQPGLFHWQEILSCHCHYTIDFRVSQHKSIIARYNGLPVHNICKRVNRYMVRGR